MLSHACLIHRPNLPPSIKECRIVHKPHELIYHEIELSSQQRLTSLTQNENVEYVMVGGEKYQGVNESLESPLSTPFYYISPDLPSSEVNLLIQSICGYWIIMANQKLKFSNDLAKVPQEFLRLIANVQANGRVIYLFQHFIIPDPKFNATRHFKLLIKTLRVFLLAQERERKQKVKQNKSYFLKFDLEKFLECNRQTDLRDKVRLIYLVYCVPYLHNLDSYDFSSCVAPKRQNS